MNLTISQIAALAAGAGFSGDDLATAVAVAMAESGGNPQAYNPEKSAGAAQEQGSFGLWQIYLAAHPEFAGVNLTDPQTNALAAYSIYSAAGDSFASWATYKSGAYTAYMGSVSSFLTASAPQSPLFLAQQSSDQGTDGTSDAVFAPDTSDLALLVGGGVLALWLLMRVLNG